MTRPLISVVMPSYNSSKHIAEAIDSILAQTYTNWELIIVDGHSTDGTLDVVESYRDKDTRIKLVFDNGQGIGAASRIGCDNCNGKFIARMDSDDVALPTRLEIEYNYLTTHPKSVMVASAAYYIDENDSIIGVGIPYRSNFGGRFFRKGVFHPSVMMLSSAYIQSGGYQPVKHAEDLFLWYRLQRLGDIKILSSPLIKYRITDGALSGYINDFLNNNIHYLWYFYSHKDVITENDINYINSIILENRTKEPVQRKPINESEFKLYKFVSSVFSNSISFKLLCLIKDIFGCFKFLR